MAGVDTRLQPREGGEAVDTENVVMLFQEVCQDLEEKRERLVTCRTVRLREKSQLKLKMLEQDKTNRAKFWRRQEEYVGVKKEVVATDSIKTRQS